MTLLRLELDEYSPCNGVRWVVDVKLFPQRGHFLGIIGVNSPPNILFFSLPKYSRQVGHRNVAKEIANPIGGHKRINHAIRSSNKAAATPIPAILPSINIMSMYAFRLIPILTWRDFRLLRPLKRVLRQSHMTLKPP
jgi:hypothetical protein